MKFPLYDISDCNWSESKWPRHTYIYENPFEVLLFFRKRKFVSKMKREKYVDCNGDLYKVVDFTFTRSKGCILNYILPFEMVELKFGKLSESISLEELRDLIISRARGQSELGYIDKASKARNFEEMIN